MHDKQHFSINLISGVMFLVFALGHALRLVTKTSILIGDFQVPIWTSVVIAILFAGLAFWNFRDARYCKNHEHHHDETAR